MSKDKIKNLCAYIDKNKAKNYPIGNAQLADATDYIKNAYFKMLAVVLQQGAEITDAQRNLFQRMIAGVNCDYAIEDYLRQALGIEIEEYVNFADQCKELPVKYRFILDAMLLTAVEEKNEEQLKLTANFVESLKISKDEIAYLAQLAKAILNQSACDYADSEENKPTTVPSLTASEYVQNLCESNLICGQRMTIASVLLPGKAVDNAIDLSNVCKTPVLKLTNMRISMKQCSIKFHDFEKVFLENCEFESGECPVYFTNCQNIYITNCSFRHFKTRTIIESSVTNIEFVDTTFEDCYLNYSRSTNDWIPCGCVIRSDTPNKNSEHRFVRCEFVSCGGKNSSNYYSSAFICDCKSDVIDSSFKNCWHYHSYSDKDSDNSKRTMFAAGSNAVNCAFEDCAAFS